jgi:type IV pilus assembly protein PilF
MKRFQHAALLVLMAWLILSGCQSNSVRTESRGGDNTGELGSPVKRVSPANVYVELGTAYLAEDNLGEAFKNARKAVLVDDDLASAHNLLGVVHQRLGQRAKAGEHFRRAVKLDPRNPYALNALGSFLCGEEQYEEADGYFQRALENPLYPTPWIASHNAGQCAERAGQLSSAEDHYRRALRSNPRFAPSLLRMAQLSFDTDNYLSARAYLQRYAQVARHTAESLWLGLRTERQLGDKDQVASYRLKLRANFPDSEQAKFLKGAE